MTTGASLPGPFAGASMNCRACHLDVEQKGVAGGGSRTYADFARRSPIPWREDGHVVATRNAQALLNATLPRAVPLALHFDGEFATLEDLVKATLTGRNYGWLPHETAAAVAHVARVVREDDGTGMLARSFGGAPYAGVLRGIDPLHPTDRPIPTARTLDVARAGDGAVLDAVASFVADYVRSLGGATDADGAFSGSPYDQFLRLNGLPTRPKAGESDAAYTRRLARVVARLRAPRFVGDADGAVVLHDHPWRFGAEELRGLRIFLAEPRGGRAGRAQLARGGFGACATCHPAPAFTDFGLHSTGAAQEEYDAIHGAGAFAALDVPDLARREADPQAFLPPTSNRPLAPGRFRAVPSPDRPGFTDLGAWNVLHDPDVAGPERQRALARLVCMSLGARECARRRRRPDAMLAAAIGLFKTPSLRDLSHSGPHLHTGRVDTLEEVVAFYRDVAALARARRLRNGARTLRAIALTDADVAPLAAFLRALDEDFE